MRHLPPHPLHRHLRLLLSLPHTYYAFPVSLISLIFHHIFISDQWGLIIIPLTLCWCHCWLCPRSSRRFSGAAPSPHLIHAKRRGNQRRRDRRRSEPPTNQVMWMWHDVRRGGMARMPILMHNHVCLE